jgi:hypothetical protein
MVFVAFTTAAILLYPGGTWWDPNRQGHSFWQNFLCDLLHNPSLNHQNNSMGAQLASAGLQVFVAGLTVFWSMADCWIAPFRRLKMAVKALGVGGTPLVAAVPLLPSHRFPKLHTAAVVIGGLPAVLTLVLLTLGILGSLRLSRYLRYVTVLLTLLSMLCLGLYTQNAVFGGPSLRIVPALERLASIGIVLWMIALLGQTGRQAPEITIERKKNDT